MDAAAADREKRKEKHKEFLSLVLWLQSLQPPFGEDQVIIRGDEKQVNVDDVLQTLNRIDIALAIREIAGEVCNQPITENEARSYHPAKHASTTAVAEQIWTSILMLTSTQARPIVQQSQQQNDNHDGHDENHNQHNNTNHDELKVAATTSTVSTSTMATVATNNTGSSSNSNKMSPTDLKAYTMANILDCAVNNPDKVKRREYIEGILGLNKSTQKRLMAMVNRRVSAPPNNNNNNAIHKANSHMSNTTKKNSNNNAIHQSGSNNSNNRKMTFRSVSTPRPGGSFAMGEPMPQTPRSRARAASAERATQRTTTTTEAMPAPSKTNFRSALLGNCASALHIARVDSTDGDGSSLGTTLSGDSSVGSSSHSSCVFNEINNDTTTNMANNNMNTIVNHNNNTINNNNSSPDTPYQQQHRHQSNHHNNGQTPPPPYRLQHSRNNRLSDVSDQPVPPGFLSPGTMESPGAIQTIVGKLQHRNEVLDGKVADYQKREVDWRQELERLQQEYRQEMMKIETAALQREQDTQQQYEQRLLKMRREMEAMQNDVENGKAAAIELQQAREDMDIMEHNKRILAETTQKLQKYKDKVTELQDAKNALQEEQEAHDKAVDEICRLEHEIKLLMPFKKQVEEYKIRAIEAEVKLVENQDLLRRMEEELHATSADNDSLWKESVNQKEHMEELVKRIHEETQANIEQGIGSGIGEGFSELNPEIKSELVRLRNENLQLRAFAAKRQDDQVTRLESKLGDTQALAKRYKDEYLSTKNALLNTQSFLTDSQQREANLTHQVEQLTQQVEEGEQECRVMEGNLTHTTSQLQSAKQSLSLAKEDNERLRSDIDELQQRIQKVESISQERLFHMNLVSGELESTKTQLESSERTVHELQETVKAWESSGKQMEKEILKTQEDLVVTTKELEQKKIELGDSTQHVRQLQQTAKSLEEQKQQLEEQLEEERRSNADALEATRQILTAKFTQEIEEQATNMNILLEDERKAGRAHQEESEKEIQKLHDENEQIKERFASSIKNSRQEAQERVDFLRSEHKAEMEDLKTKHKQEVQNVKKEDENKLEDIIRKGKGLIEKAKDGARQQLREMADQCTALEEKLEAEIQAKHDQEEEMRGTINALKHKLELSVGQVSSLSQEIDGLDEKLKLVQREKYKLQEDNDRYRRQISGRNGADGGRAHLEQLQQEYKEVLDENRHLKQQIRNMNYSNQGGGGGGGLGTISETYMGESSSSSQYSNHNSVSRSTLQQYHLDYEQTIERVTGEKRELVMKHASAIADVQRAEQRVAEREQIIARVSAENTSLKLALQRADLSLDQSFTGRSAMPASPLSFVTAREEEEDRISSSSPGGIFKPVQHHHHRSGSPSVERGSPPIGRGSPARSSSPSIDRAKQQKASQELALRNRLSAMNNSTAWSPPRHNRGSNNSSPSLEERSTTTSVAAKPIAASPAKIKGILSPTRKHEYAANQLSQKSDTDFGFFGATGTAAPPAADSHTHKTNVGSDFGAFNPSTTNASPPAATSPKGRKVRLSNEPPMIFDYFNNSQSMDSQEEQDITQGWERQFTA